MTKSTLSHHLNLLSRRDVIKFGLGLMIPPFLTQLSPDEPNVSEAPDFILYNAEIITLDKEMPSAKAVAIKGKHIIAIGPDDEVKKIAGKNTKLFDLKGKTVIPGLVDTHAHAIRGAQTFYTETFWYYIPSLKEALEELRKSAKSRAEGKWVSVLGSWSPEQFEEQRAPTVAELSEAVPDHPVFVQYLYDYALLNDCGIAALKLNDQHKLPFHGIRVERDKNGLATGKLFGSIGSFGALVAEIIQTGEFEVRKASMKNLFAKFNSVGVTGFIDPSTGPMENFNPLFALWKEDKLTLRAAYRISALKPGNEAEWFKTAIAFKDKHDSSGLLTFAGIGESLVFGMNDGVRMGPGFKPEKGAHEELVKVGIFAAAHKIPVEIHAYNDDTASAILDAFEEVDKVHSIYNLRWAIAHLNTGSAETLKRMKKLGLAYTVQMGPYFEAPAILEANGEEVATGTPPTRIALDTGLKVAGGTDSTRIGMYGVWQAIEYQITGTSLGGAVQRRSDLLLTRMEALRLYTENAAWLLFKEHERGTLSSGKIADLAVLDQPYLSMPATEIHDLKSVLTVVDGKIVHQMD